MESKFYQADEHRAEKVHELFATIARRYDLLNDLMSLGLHRRWKRRLVRMVQSGVLQQRVHGIPVYKPLAILDLCCGTGDLAAAFLRENTNNFVVGADFSGEMLNVAKLREDDAPPSIAHKCEFRDGEIACSEWPNPVRWLRADALRLPFADGSFDAVSVGYGLRNLADIEQGLREIKRVLRPGGKFVALDFGKPESRVFRAMYFAYLQIALPILGQLFCGDRDTHGYILASLQNYPAQRGIKQLLEAQGFRDCGFEEFWLGSMAINFGVKAG